MKIGIPRSLYYYHYKDLWLSFFKRLNIDVVISDKTTKEIMKKGIELSNDEMCIALKNYLGHVVSLKGLCDYVLIPRIDNYGINNQMCTNYMSTYDIIDKILDIPIISYNVSLSDRKTEEKEFEKWSSILKKSKKEIKEAYNYALEEVNKKSKYLERKNIEKLESKKTKILIVSHPYNIFDEYIGLSIINSLKKYDVEIIYSEYFNKNKTSKLGNVLSSGLYFKYSKEEIGSILMCKDKIDGILFLTAFPCALDSLVIPLVLRKVDIPTLHLLIDEENSMTGIITRLESFIDIIERNKIHD